MTQQAYYPPQFPGFPQQGEQPYPQQYAPPAQQYPPAGYPQQGYAPPAPPQQPAGPPPAQGSIDAFFSQPSAGGGPGISWSVNGMPKPEGTTVVGTVARDVTNGDIQQQSDPKTGALKSYRDGRPMFQMTIPLKVQPSQEFPDGEAVLYVRGQMKDELTRAMAEANAGTSPKAGDQLAVQLVRRKPNRGGGMPTNIFAIRYQAANPGQAPAADPAPAPQPVEAQQAAQQYGPVQTQEHAVLAQQPPLQTIQNGDQFVQGQPASQFQQPVAQAQPQQPVQQAQPQFQQPALPVQQPVAQQGPAAPTGMTPEQAQLFAQLSAQQG